MKEQIYTIPVNEAFDENCTCPFCVLLHKLESERVTYTLGASMMEPDARTVTNSLGFCDRHFKMLFNEPNKLSLALVLDTHLQSVREKLKTSVIGIGDAKKGGLFKKKNVPTAQLLSSSIDNNISSCAICKSVDTTMERYIDVFFYMWENEPDFHKKWLECNGVCLPHYSMLAKKCDKYLKSNNANKFLCELVEKEDTLFSSLQEDIHKFTLKFDYRNSDMPWGSAKDAPKRVIEYLCGESLSDKNE